MRTHEQALGRTAQSQHGKRGSPGKGSSARREAIDANPTLATSAGRCFYPGPTTSRHQPSRERRPHSPVTAVASRSPGGAKRNPGSAYPLVIPFPDFASLHPGYGAKSRSRFRTPPPAWDVLARDDGLAADVIGDVAEVDARQLALLAGED